MVYKIDAEPSCYDGRASVILPGYLKFLKGFFSIFLLIIFLQVK